jgi:nicotinamidase-related amidase
MRQRDCKRRERAADARVSTAKKTLITANMRVAKLADTFRQRGGHWVFSTDWHKRAVRLGKNLIERADKASRDYWNSQDDAAATRRLCARKVPVSGARG